MHRPVDPPTQPSTDAGSATVRTSEAKNRPAPGRTVVEPVTPMVDGGRFAAKASIGEAIEIVADVFADGHDVVAATADVVVTGHPTERVPMHREVNDRWRGHWTPRHLGAASIEVVGAVDPWATWISDARRWTEEADLLVHCEVGARLLEAASDSLSPMIRNDATACINRLRSGIDEFVSVVDDAPLADAMSLVALRDPHAGTLVSLPVWVDPTIARCSAWYEFFPRSGAGGHHATLLEAIDRLDHIAALGFDVVYLPPIHPIGTTHRKGPDNQPSINPDDVGSPWAIGGPAGGHDAVHPDLGTTEDLERLVGEARDRGLEIALDLAFQCSPDHPWVTEHPSWFRHLPDGSIRYAENPPKRYQDIYPIDFSAEDWPDLWNALADVVRHWIDLGVRMFRVDNPHTKPFAFWQWLIATIRVEEPAVVFLAEAFTAPRVMERLGKIGFSQSYTYFTWRESPSEIRDYFEDLTGRCIGYLRPNAWPNTPDILPRHLQGGGRPAFAIRAVLAATLSANWGVYGPAYELLEHEALAPDSEEYRSSEKYQLRSWNLDCEDSLAPLLARLNRIRHDHESLQFDRWLQFCDVDGDQIVAYAKPAPPRPDGSPGETMLAVINLDPHQRRSGWVDVSPAHLGEDWDSLPWGSTFEVTDLLGGASYEWHLGGNWVDLDPSGLPAHIFSIPAHSIRRAAP